MKLSSLRPRTQMLLAVLVPIVCIAVGALLVLPFFSNLRKVSKDIEITKKTIQQQQQLIAEAESAAGGRPLALAVALPDEQEPIVFLRQLAELTKTSHVTLASVRDTAPPPSPPGRASYPAGSSTAPPAPGATGSVLKGERPVVPPSLVQELTNQVTVEGTFGEVLGLLVRLENFDRILSISQCRMICGSSVKYPMLQATFSLSRFVARPAPVSPAPPTQPAAGD